MARATGDDPEERGTLRCRGAATTCFFMSFTRFYRGDITSTAWGSHKRLPQFCNGLIVHGSLRSAEQTDGDEMLSSSSRSRVVDQQLSVSWGTLSAALFVPFEATDLFLRPPELMSPRTSHRPCDRSTERTHERAIDRPSLSPSLPTFLPSSLPTSHDRPTDFNAGRTREGMLLIANIWGTDFCNLGHQASG